MTHSNPILRWCLLLATLVALGSCGGTPMAEPAVVDEPPAPAPRNAAELASAIVHAKLTTLIHIDMVRDHPLAPRVAALEAWGPVFDDTGIDPLEDVERAFVAAANAKDQQAVIVVAEHHVEAERLKKAMDKLVARSGGKGAWLPDYDVPAARVEVKGRESVIIAVTPTVLVVTSEPYAKAAKRLIGTGGLPEPEGPAAIIATADQPAVTLDAPRVPPLPPTLSTARAEVTFEKGGGADLSIEAQSTTPDQARADAVELTRTVDEATSVKISVLRVRMFKPVAFRSDGDKVIARRKLSRAELDQLLTLAAMLTE